MSALLLSDEISSHRWPQFFFFFFLLALLFGQKGKGTGCGEKVGSVKDKRRKGKVTFRLAADWSDVQRKGEEMPPTDFTSSAVAACV